MINTLISIGYLKNAQERQGWRTHHKWKKQQNMHSHTYKFGTESFKILSMAFRKSPFKGCCEFLTMGLIYCRLHSQHVRDACTDLQNIRQDVESHYGYEALTCSMINPMNPVNIINLTNWRNTQLLRTDDVRG